MCFAGKFGSISLIVGKRDSNDTRSRSSAILPGGIMEFQKLIRHRRSIRGFKPDPVPEDVLQRILESAAAAPTAANRQPFQLIVVTDQKVRFQFRAAYDREWFYSAPMILIGCGETEKAWTRADGFNSVEVDVSIMMDHVILAAANEGMGSCWICNFDESKVREILGIPADIRVIAMTPLGYPSAEPRPFLRKPLAELVRRERW
jgi:nitroreductase